MFKIAKVEKWKDFANNFVNGYEFLFFIFSFRIFFFLNALIMKLMGSS